MERFQRDLAANEGAQVLERDIAEGDRLGIRMTPSTFINGRMLGGRQSLEVLQQHVDAILDPNAPAPVASAQPSPALADPAVEIEFFADFGNPDTAALHAAVAEFREAHPEASVRLLHLPSADDPAAVRAHQAALAADRQGKGSEMTQLVLAIRTGFDASLAAELAGRLGLDTRRFSADLDDPAIQARLAEDREHARQLGVARGPALFLNGNRLEGLRSAAQLTKLMNDPCCSKRRPASPGTPAPDAAEVDIFANEPTSP
jgi:predicted DsbA family dithiol-disulfide isomerase